MGGDGDHRDSEACREFLKTLACAYRIHAIKTYRIRPETPAGVPVIPCLDHEARLHGRVAPHVSAYLQEESSGDLHEVGCHPARSILVVDTASTAGEHGSDSQARLLAFLAERFPERRVRVSGPSWLRGDRRAAESARAQVTLREILTGPDFDSNAAALQRLRAVAALMEKESRVASWAVRTAYVPALVVAGFVIVRLFDETVETLALSLLGGVLLYLGMMAVHLTGVGNRVWKRAAEYDLIVAERKRRH